MGAAEKVSLPNPAFQPFRILYVSAVILTTLFVMAFLCARAIGIGDLTHEDFEDRISQIGYSEYHCGEIIAMYGGWSSNLGREFVDMWLGSIEHRKIMLTALNGYMGVGVSKISTTFYAVVDFRFS